MAKSVQMDTFKWVVGGLLVVITGLLGTIATVGGSYIGSMQTDLREVRKDVTDIRIQNASANTKLDALITEFKRR